MKTKTTGCVLMLRISLEIMSPLTEKRLYWIGQQNQHEQINALKVAMHQHH